MSQTITVPALVKILRMDFKAADLGDTTEDFDARLKYVAGQAILRETATPAQQEAGARYLLIAAIIRQTRRQAEELRGASGSSIRQDLATKLKDLRLELLAQEQASGLGAQRPARTGSISVRVESGF